MRKSTFASLLILCGSTAALANAGVPAGQVPPQTLNNSVTPTDPTPDTLTPDTANETTTNVPMPDTTTANETSTVPAETPTTGNETVPAEPTPPDAAVAEPK